MPENKCKVHETKWTALKGKSETITIRNEDSITPPSVTDKTETKSVSPWRTQTRSANT